MTLTFNPRSSCSSAVVSVALEMRSHRRRLLSCRSNEPSRPTSVEEEKVLKLISVEPGEGVRVSHGVRGRADVRARQADRQGPIGRGGRHGGGEEGFSTVSSERGWAQTWRGAFKVKMRYGIACIYPLSLAPFS